MDQKIPFGKRTITALLRFIFSLLYHQFAWTYDWVAAVVSIGMWKQWTQVVIPYLNGEHILEIGHGPGHLLVTLNQMSRLVVGLDRSPQMSRIARGRLQRHSFPIQLILGDAKAIPLPAECLDHIVVTFPSEYIFDTQTLVEALRVLKPGGTLIIVPFAWITGTRLTHRTAAWLFKITGESPKMDLSPLQPLLSVGFLAVTEKIELAASKVLVIRAKKPPI